MSLDSVRNWLAANAEWWVGLCRLLEEATGV
jgi:hypothetical protein